MTTAQNARALRSVSLLYFLFFGSHGALLPFIPLFFEARGLSATDISLLMVLLPISNLVIPPLWGILADSIGSRSKVLRFCLLMYSASVLALIPDQGFWGSLGVMVLFALFRSPVTALTDAVAHAQLGPAIERFGKIRLWGSVGFLACSRLYGYLYDNVEQSHAIGSVSLLILAAAFASRALDAEGTQEPHSRKEVFSETRSYMLQPQVLILLLGVFIYYAGHSTFDAYFGLHMRALGFNYDFIGTAWAIGVGTEVLLMTQAHRILTQIKPITVLAVCGLVATFRWGLLSELSIGTQILWSQPLHGITFGMFYLSMVNQVQKYAPPDVRATVQSIALASMSMGMIVGYLGGGYVFESFGGSAVFFGAMCAAALAALIFLAAPRLHLRAASLQGRQEGIIE